MPSYIDLLDSTLKEYRHYSDGSYYFNHPLFHEEQSYNSIHEVALNTSEIHKTAGFLMSPLLEVMNLEFNLHKHVGRIRITSFEDHYDQLNDLITQGLLYAIIHGSLKSIADSSVPPVQCSQNPEDTKSRPDKNKKHLLIKIPTRSRPQKFFETLDRFYAKLSGEIPYTFLITCDADDETMNNPKVIERLKTYKNLYVYFGEGSTKVDAYNRDIEKHLDFDVLLVASDDLEPVRQNFDKAIFNYMRTIFPDFDGVLRFEDINTPHDINQYPIIGKKYYDRFGYIYYPEYKSLYCDNEFVDVANSLNKEGLIKALLFKHKHPLLMAVESDDLYKYNESKTLLNHDHDLYYARKNLDFGSKINRGSEIMSVWGNRRKVEECERNTLKLSSDEISDYQKIIKDFKGRMSAQEFARRLNKLIAKTHVIQLADWQINDAQVSFIYYKVDRIDGKEYLHPYLHADKEFIEKIRHANGTVHGGSVKVTNGILQNTGFIQADKQLILKVNSLLNERPKCQKLADLYPGGEVEGATVDAITKNDFTNVGGAVKSTDGDTTITTGGELKSIPQVQANPNSADKATGHHQAELGAQGGSLNLNSDKSITIEGTAQSATEDINKKAKKNIIEKTLIDIHKEEITLPDGTHRIIEVPTVVATTNVAGGHIKREAGETLSDEGVENLSVGDQINKAKIIISKPAVVNLKNTESQLSCGLLGCSGKERETLQTFMIQPHYTALKGSVINQSDLETTLEGVVIVADKKIHLKAGKKLTVKGAKETTSTTESDWSFGVSFMGSDALQSAMGGNYNGAALQLAQTSKLATSLLALMESASKKGSAADVITNAEYMGLEAVREFVAFSKTPEGSGLKGGLGVVGQQIANNAMQLSFGLSFYDVKTESFTTNPSSFNCARLEVEAPEATLVGVQAEGNSASFKGETLNLLSEESGKTSSNSATGVTLSAGLAGVGIGGSATTGHSTETNHLNTNLKFEDQKFDERDINAQGANAYGETAEFIDVKNLKIASEQATKQAAQAGESAFASTSGAMSGSASYENQDMQKVEQRSGFNFKGKVTGSIDQVDLTGADLTGGSDSTVKIGQMQGHDLHDHDYATKVAAAAGYNQGDPVPVVLEPNVKVDKDAGTQHAYSNLGAGKKDNVVDDPSKAYEQTENTHWHMRFVLAALDMKQIHEAEQKMHALFDTRKKLRVKDAREAFAAYGMPDAREEILRLKAEREKAQQGQATPDQQESKNDEQKTKTQPDQTSQEKNQDDDLEVFDEDEVPGKHDDDDCLRKQKPSEQQTQSEMPKTNAQASSEDKKPKTSYVDSAKQEESHRPDKATPQRHIHTTKSGKPIIIDVAEHNENPNQSLETINLEDIASDNDINTIALRNNLYTITITGEKEAFVDMLLDRKMLINHLIAQSGAPYSEPVATDEHHTLKVVASILLDFVPGLGNVKMGAEAISGVDLVTGEPLATWQRVLLAAGAASPILARGAKALYEGLNGLSKATETANDLSKVAKTAEVGGQVGATVAKAEKVLLPTTKEAAEEVGKLFNGVIEKTKGSGWKVTILDKNGETIVIRLMDAGSGGRTVPYFRVSIGGKGSLNLAGKISSDRGLTHIDLTDKYLDMIKNMINNH